MGKEILHKAEPGSQPGQGPALPTNRLTLAPQNKGHAAHIEGNPAHIALVTREECAVVPYRTSPTEGHFLDQEM